MPKWGVDRDITLDPRIAGVGGEKSFYYCLAVRVQ